jgi:acetoin utilization deacetylase AcuC-like enzyme
MKIIYNEKFEARYQTNPVESPNRVKKTKMELIKAGYEFVDSLPAREEDIRKVHGPDHINNIKARGLYESASLAAGGAVLAAELAMQGHPSFALIRPPGHHAAANRAWGLCFFNNIAIAVQKIRRMTRRILIIDIDLHYGDGTMSIFRGDHDIIIVNPGSVDINFDYLNQDVQGYLMQIKAALEDNEYDIIGVSAGFDTYVKDWGGLLETKDYEEIAKLIVIGSQKCQGRRFAVLEGGYHSDLALNIKSFIKGFA